MVSSMKKETIERIARSGPETKVYKHVVLAEAIVLLYNCILHVLNFKYMYLKFKQLNIM